MKEIKLKYVGTFSKALVAIPLAYSVYIMYIHDDVAAPLAWIFIFIAAFVSFRLFTCPSCGSLSAACFIVKNTKCFKCNEKFKIETNQSFNEFAANYKLKTWHICAIVIGVIGAAVFFVSNTKDKTVFISKAEYGAAWPYSLSSGRLSCKFYHAVVLDNGYGSLYALNGKAMQSNKYIDARESIMLRDANGTFIGDSHAIIKRGLALCEN